MAQSPETLRSPKNLIGVASPDQGEALSDAQKERYRAAIAALKRSAFGRDPKSLSAALDVAMYHCEKARAFDRPEGDVRKRSRKAAISWHSANAAAFKLAVHFENLDHLTGAKRLAAALLKANVRMTAELPENREPLHLAFARLLRALRKQTPRGVGGGYRIGPLRVGKSSLKLPSREVVLTVLLAHLFDRVASHDGVGVLNVMVGEPISSGKAWDVAADFASAALERSIEPSAARKFLSDHRDHLFYQGWPEPSTA